MPQGTKSPKAEGDKTMTERELAKLGCKVEAEHCLKLTEKAMECIEQGDLFKANRFLNNADCPFKCASNEHEDLWRLTGGDMTEEEWKYFELVEIAQIKFRNACNTWRAARDRQIAEEDA